MLRIFVLLAIVIPAFANQTATDYQKDQSFISQNKSDAQQSANAFTPNKLPGYTPNPSQTQYYGGVTQTDTNIASQGQAQLSKDPGGDTVYKNYATRPQIKINTQSPAIQQSKLIEKDSYNLTHGISDQYVDCQKKYVNCTTTYTEKTCIGGYSRDLMCTSSVDVHIKRDPYWFPEKMALNNTNVVMDSSSIAKIKIPSREGIITGMHIHFRDGGNPWSCSRSYSAWLNGTSVGTEYPSCGDGLGDLDFGGKDLKISYQNSEADLKLQTASWSGGVSGYLDFEVKRYHLTPVSESVSSCQSIPANCHQTSSKCIEPGSTKTIGGVPVYESCWKTQTNYQCGTPESSTCKTLESQGCQQVGQSCTEQGCKNLYQCPAKQCATQMVCSHDVFCIDGDCTKTHPTQNKNFGKDVSELAGVAGAAQDFDKNHQVSMFSGHGVKCSIYKGGYSNCCDPSGWGQAIGLAHCGDDAKELAQAWKKYLLHYVGEYCSKDPLGICIEHKKVYCVYDSKMARIVQDYGHTQLHMGYGSPESPDCNGLTVDQIQKVDFNKIDFVNPIYMYPSGGPNSKAGLASDMSVDGPTQSQMNDEINKRIQEDLKNKTGSDNTNLSDSIHKLKAALFNQVESQK